MSSRASVSESRDLLWCARSWPQGPHARSLDSADAPLGMTPLVRDDSNDTMISKARIILGVCALWLLLGALWGAQTALGSSVMGDKAIPLLSAVKDALQQILPWVPVTLAVIALTVRFPLSRDTWLRYAPMHLVAAALLAFAANVLVVLMY